MCWVSQEAKRMVADRDIVCYKVVRLISEKRCFPFFWEKRYHYESSFRGYHYVQGEANPIESLEVEEIMSVAGFIIDTGYSINRGYHSLASIEHAREWRRLQHMVMDANICCVRCFIPKGSEYYLNGYGEYVSSNIVLCEPI